ncbi:MAG TPA: ABC transporter permease [Chitinophagaceae bacterium]
MFKNYFITAFRNLRRNKKHALLNIAGLAVAIAVCWVIFLVIKFETSYDSFHTKKDHIYQVVTKDIDADGEQYSSGVPFPGIKFLRQDHSQVTFAQLMQRYGVQVTVTDASGAANNKKFIEETGVFYAEPELLKIFDVKWLSGNENVLKEPNNVVLSRSVAEKYFGSWQQAAGNFLKVDNNDHILSVAAVFEDVPANTDFPFGFIASYEGWTHHEGKEWPLDDWGSNTSNHQVYALLPGSASIDNINSYLQGFEKKYNTNNKDTKRTHFLQPLSAIHFDNRFSNNGDHITSKRSLYTLGFIGLLIIVMACINFINLSTALAVTRSKEVGVRKVMGGSKAQLRWQVLAETTTVVLAATLLATVLAWLALPYIKYIMVVQARLDLFTVQSALFILTVMLATIILSGLYPAFILSRFKPVEAIKNKINTTKVGSISLRRVLVVLQFACSQVLVVATIIAISQMSFIQNSDLGFNKEAVLLIQGNSDSASRSKQQAFKNELLARNDVKAVSFGFDAPSSDNSWQSNFAFDVMEDREFNLTLKFGDKDYLKTYDLHLAAGKFYDNSDTARGFVVNETFVKKVGLKSNEEAVGKMLRLGGREPKPVIGVVKDFKMQSLREEVVPIAIFPNQKYAGIAGIKLSSKNLLKSRDEINALWDKFYPEYVYNSAFFDENIDRFYEQEQRLSLMYKVCALLAIFISCLGLYGLISFMVVQKTKEVGVRKVLGASVGNILYLFSKEFTILIGVAFLLAAPAAWFMMNTWLRDFVYRINIGAGVFILAILISLVIAWVTVGYKAFRAAVANPVKSLRTE